MSGLDRDGPHRHLASWLWLEDAVFIPLEVLSQRSRNKAEGMDLLGVFLHRLWLPAKMLVPHGLSYRRVTSDEFIDHRLAILSYGLTTRLMSPSFQAI